MMRLPWFEYRAPKTIAEAARILAGEGAHAMLIAGGTDLLPNMKRRQMAPKLLVSLSGIGELKRNGSVYGAGLTLTQIVNSNAPKALRQAAHQVATVHLRNMGTLGGNLCLDTRCNYYNQNYEWRKAIDFCLKKDGEICWVATASKRCVAASSTDCAPALLALGATVKLVSSANEREVALEQFYNNDGIEYLKKRADEIVTEIRIPRSANSTYWKLRRRGAFDFPVLGVAARVDFARDGSVSSARIVLGAIASYPQEIPAAAEAIVGTRLDESAIGAAADAAYRPAKPMDNTDFTLAWRKEMVRVHVQRALQDIRAQSA
jgi:4-hydroxybenzoyl-CoA reductase subunit beta